MSQDDDREVFPFPGKVKSSVWEFFGFYKNIYGTLDKSRAICKLCKKGVNYSGNTTNLRTHIVHHHKNIASSYDYTRPGYAGGSRSSTLNSDANLNQSFQSQSTVDSFLHIVSPGKNTRHTYEDILVTPETAGCSSKNIIHGPSWMTEVVSEVHNKENPLQENSSGSFADSDVESSSGYMYVRELVFDAIIHDLIPLESLDTSRFQKLIGFGRRNVIVPSSEDITNDILKRFNDLQAVVFSDLSLMPNKSYKIEFWETSCYQYVTIYVSGMYDNWKARNFVLSTTELQSNEVEDVMDVLNEKILDVGGSIVVSSSNEVTTQYTEDKNCIFLEALCCTIDKAAKICIQESVVYNLIKKVQKVVKHFSKYETEALLREKQAALNMPSKELISCNIKVWTSCLDMFEVIQEQSNAVIAACMDSVTDDMKDGKLLNADFALIQTVISILKPLKTAINLTKDMKYPTASVVLPVMKKLEVCLTKTDADWCIIAELKAKMVSALKESYENESVRDFLLLSSFLDPRFKGLKFVDQSDQDHAHDLLKKSALEMKNQSVQPRDSSTNGSSSALKLDAIVKIEVDDDYQGGACTSWSTGVGKQKSETNENEPKLKKIKVKNQTTQINDSLADDWFADVILELKEDKAEEDSVSVEINRYKCEMQVSSSASPLTWWRDRQKSFPLLSEVAKRYIFVPCVLGCKDDVSEKWFKRQRNSIAPNLVEPLLFLHSNYDKFVCK